MNNTISDIKEKKDNFALYFLFPEAVAFDLAILEKCLHSVSKKKVEVNPIVNMDSKEKNLFARVKVEDEVFELVGMNTPLPKHIIDYTIGCAYGTPEELEQMKRHGYHILVFYRGENKDRMAVFNAYKKLAYAFTAQGLLCVANPYSWNVISAKLIKGMIEDDETRAFAETPAMMIWRSFIKIPYNDGVWFVTKGNNLFGVAEYAYFGKFEEMQDVYDILENIFNYVYETKGVIEAGDTMQIEEDTFLRFRPVYELEEQLKGETIETLVVEKVTEAEVNA